MASIHAGCIRGLCCRLGREWTHFWTQNPVGARPILFRFTLFWEKSILIIEEVRERRIKIIEEGDAGDGGRRAEAASHAGAARREPVGATAMGRNSEEEVLFAAIRGQPQAHLRGAVGAFHG